MSDIEVKTESITVAALTIAAQVAWGSIEGGRPGDQKPGLFAKHFKEVYTAMAALVPGVNASSNE